ncbi:uncharacterized protein ARMOST_03418 [Armillaria ostoyae]|uniref:Uncharacterized protein n=1 Tax=Armillaria ostoyae TaxID=47428 RepID=A0A284QUG8_ARMOS|nr:uncharacterized protein ARMOST_03418 [Armillaria ostoyae]
MSQTLQRVGRTNHLPPTLRISVYRTIHLYQRARRRTRRGKGPYEEYETIPTISDPVLPEKKSSTSLPHVSPSPSPPAPSSPSENPESLSSSVQTLQPTATFHTPPHVRNHHLEQQPAKFRERTPTPIPTPEPGLPTPATSQETQETVQSPPSPLPTYDELLQQVDAAAREELATCLAKQIERTITRDRTATQFYERASRPQLESETTTQYWQRQRHPRRDKRHQRDRRKTYRQRPRPITPIWLHRYREYRSHQMERGLPGVSIATWMEYRARAGDRDPRRAGTRVQEYMAFQASAYTNRSDLDAFGGRSGMDASGSS